jgi:hypothetical protein
MDKEKITWSEEEIEKERKFREKGEKNIDTKVI